MIARSTPCRSVAELALHVGGELRAGDPSRKIRCAAPLEAAHAEALSFIDDPRRLAESARAGCLLVTTALAERVPAGNAVITTDAPRAAFAMAAHLFALAAPRAPGRHPSAVIDPSAQIADDASVGPGAVIEAEALVGPRAVIEAGVFVGHRATIGADSLILPRAILMPGTIVGARCVIHPGAILGADGFGFASRPRADGTLEHLKIPQQGRVVIEDDVEIGAGACVDRATFGETRVGRGTKIDNLVQIGHNVEVGRDVLIAAQSGVAGSSRLGDGARMGAQSGVADHITIGPGATLLARAGVMSDVPSGARVAGAPARRAFSFFRELATLDRLAREPRRRSP